MKKLCPMVRSAIARLFGRQKVGTPKVRKTAPLLEELDVFELTVTVHSINSVHF